MYMVLITEKKLRWASILRLPDENHAQIPVGQRPGSQGASSIGGTVTGHRHISPLFSTDASSCSAFKYSVILALICINHTRTDDYMKNK